MSRRFGVTGDEPRLVVITGGEPMLQLDTDLLARCTSAASAVAVETQWDAGRDARDRLALR